MKEGTLASLGDPPEGKAEGEGARVYLSLEECYQQGWVAPGDREMAARALSRVVNLDALLENPFSDLGSEPGGGDGARGEPAEGAPPRAPPDSAPPGAPQAGVGGGRVVSGLEAPPAVKAEEEAVARPADAAPLRMGGPAAAEADGPATPGAEYASDAGSCRRDEVVEYCSVTHKERLPASVTSVDAEGRIMVDVKPNVWLSLDVQGVKVRPGRGAEFSQPQAADEQPRAHPPRPPVGPSATWGSPGECGSRRECQRGRGTRGRGTRQRGPVGEGRRGGGGGHGLFGAR